MRFRTVTVYCPGCGAPRLATRRVRDRRCGDCRREAERAARRGRLADALVPLLALGGPRVPRAVVLRVLEAERRHRGLLRWPSSSG